MSSPFPDIFVSLKLLHVLEVYQRNPVSSSGPFGYGRRCIYPFSCLKKIFRLSGSLLYDLFLIPHHLKQTDRISGGCFSRQQLIGEQDITVPDHFLKMIVVIVFLQKLRHFNIMGSGKTKRSALRQTVRICVAAAIRSTVLVPRSTSSTNKAPEFSVPRPHPGSFQ